MQLFAIRMNGAEPDGLIDTRPIDHIHAYLQRSGQRADGIAIQTHTGRDEKNRLAIAVSSTRRLDFIGNEDFNVALDLLIAANLAIVHEKVATPSKGMAVRHRDTASRGRADMRQKQSGPQLVAQ